jgi:hypothetical protein
VRLGAHFFYPKMVSAAISLLAVKRGYALEVLYADLVVP